MQPGGEGVHVDPPQTLLAELLHEFGYASLDAVPNWGSIVIVRKRGLDAERRRYVLLGVNACVLRISGRLLNFLLSSGEVFARYSSSGSQPSSLSFSRILQIGGFSEARMHRVRS